MNPEDIYAIFDNLDEEVISVHPFRYLAEQRLRLHFEQPGYEDDKERYYIATLAECIAWQVTSAVEKVEARNIHN